MDEIICKGPIDGGRRRGHRCGKARVHPCLLAGCASFGMYKGEL